MNLASLWQQLVSRLTGRTEEPDRKEEQELVEQVAAAHREWQAAKAHFQMVSEPELVDHAIFHLEAAQRKYIYLLNLVRRRRQQMGRKGDAPWM
ncbi:MAG TPA: DUF2508 family protein [Symbiobacteriaceae bacterium]